MSVTAASSSLMLALPYAWGPPSVKAVLRQHPECFFVEERLGFEPAASGEHVFLLIEKKQLNTQCVADRLAAVAGVARRQVSYCGMKDRQAVTRQWFSVHLPGVNSVAWRSLNSDNLSVLQAVRHRKKLRRGTHRGNWFRIRLTQLQGDPAELERRLTIIRANGVPNYFGEQRFGHSGANLDNARRWFAGQLTAKRHQRSLYLSAARAFIFNQLLALRVQQHHWDKAGAGELLMLKGSRSVFVADEADLTERLHSGDIHPTGPLYGQPGCTVSNDAIARLENGLFRQYPDLIAGLEKAGLKHERRALRMIPEQLTWQFDNRSVELSFMLDRGCFATSLVRELVNYRVEH